MFVGVEGDWLTPAEHSRALYELAPKPKDLFMLSDITHHDVRQPEQRADLIDRATVQCSGLFS